MPGIVGLFALDGRALDPTITPTLEAMSRAIAHRGPASPRVRFAGPCALVTPDDDRPDDLPILGAADGIDLATAMASHARHGEDLARHLHGRFACALYDPVRARLVLARDALGVRPLFYARIDTTRGPLLAFASEVKALLTHPDCPRALDWTLALAHEAMPRKVFAPTSFFRGIEPLPMGGVLVADVHGRIEVRAHDVLGAVDHGAVAADTRSATDVVAQFRETFIAVVRDALGPEPTRSGLLLSGGIDSLAIAAVAARSIGAEIPAFTVLGQSTWGNGEARRAHEAATRLGLPEHQVLFGWDEPMRADDWRRLVWLCETPHAGPQHLYKLHLARHAAYARPDLTRLLNGEGSDELMGADFRNHGEDRPDATYDDYLADLADKQRVDLHTLETLAVESWLGRPVQSRAALARAAGRPLPPYPFAQRWTYCLPGLAQSTLWRDDRIAAGHGMLADTPYLDRRLVDFVLHIPRRLHGELFWQKRMLRDAMVGLVPEPLRTSPKTGFFVGVDARYTTRLLHAMLMADDRALVRDALGDGDHPELAPGLIDALVAESEADPEHGAATVLLTLVNLGLLDAMAKDLAHRPGPVMEIAPRPALAGWDEVMITHALRGETRVIGPDMVLALGPGVELVRKDEAGVPDHVWYVLVDDQARFVLDEEDTRPWCEVLRKVDGRRPLAELLAERGIAFADIAKHLDEALRFDVVVEA